jgi:metal-dependent hydrolase (beta-lactamase superfamily II)
MNPRQIAWLRALRALFAIEAASLALSHMEIGANTAVTAKGVTSASAMADSDGSPPSRPRSAVVIWLTGLTVTKACSHPGIVSGAT